MDKIKLAVGSTNNTCPFNATDHPALNVPCGWSMSRDFEGWLPVGMQISQASCQLAIDVVPQGDTAEMLSASTQSMRIAVPSWDDGLPAPRGVQWTRYSILAA